MNSEQLMRMYHEGKITETEVCSQLFSVLRDGHGFLRDAPEEMRKIVLKKVEESPSTDEEWDKVRILQMGGWCGYTAERYQQVMDQMKKDWRLAVEAIRKVLKETQ
jgi:hypothetical protein